MSSNNSEEESVILEVEPEIGVGSNNEVVSSTHRSPAWNFFKLNTEGYRKAICNTCSKVLKLPTSTTSPMLKHLYSTHPILYQKCVEIGKKGIVAEESKSTKESPKRQKLGPPTKAELDQLCMEMIAIDLKPFSCVEDTGFRRLLKRLDSTYDPPSSTTCSRSLCPNLYEQIKQKLMDELQNDIASGLMSLSFTTDGWKSRSGHHYLSLTVHYMTSNFQLKNLMIGLTQLEDRHTGNYIKLKLEEMMLEWNLLDVPNVPIFFTTDNGANICNAIRQSSWNHIHCFAHTLQLVIKDCQKHTKGIEKLLKKARHITTHFHQSDPARRDFENAQKVSSDKTPLKLIQSVPTRWNSDYDMLERMKKLQQPLSVALSRSASVTGLSGTDWKRISDIINVLDPLNEATKISCGSKYPTISMIEPIIQGMKEALENLNFDHETNVGLNNFNDEGSDYDDNNNDEDLEISTCENESQMPMGYNFSTNIIRSLKIRFCEIEQDTLYRKCTFLDPRYRDYFLTDEKMKDDIKKGIKDEIIACKFSNNVFENEHETVAEPPVIKPTKFWDFMKQRQTNREETVTLRLEKDIDQELIQYMYSENIDPWDDPIQWWKKESIKYPLLSLMARRYLPIPSTSVESERLFSTAGDIVTEKRNSLSPDNVARLLFLNKNLNRYV